MSTAVGSGRVRHDRVRCEACGRAVRAKVGEDGELRPILHKDRRTGERCNRKAAVPPPAPSGTWPRVECRVCGRAVRAKLAAGVLRPLLHKDRSTGERCEARRDPVPVLPAPRPSNDGAIPAALAAVAAVGAEGDVATSLARLPPEARKPIGGHEERARLLALAASAGRRTYRMQWALFRLWCESIGARPLPAHPDLLRIYAVHLGSAGRKPASVVVALYAIVSAHEACNLAAPLFEAHRELRRVLVSEQSPSISHAELKSIVATCDGSAMGLRDRALLLVAYHSRMRSCRVVELNAADLQRDADGYSVRVQATGKRVRLGRLEEPDICPVRALDRWLAKLLDARSAEGEEAPLFIALHPQRRPDVMLGERLGAGDVARILKRRVAAAQLDARRFKTTALRAATGGAAVHSPRSGRAA